MRTVIAICGLKRSGKDVIADHLVRKYSYEKIKIAEPLKIVVAQLFNFTQDQVGETDQKDEIDPRWGITPRHALQFFGTEVMQYKIQDLLPNIERKFWINLLISKMQPEKKYVISDMRFKHEYEELKKHDLLVIKVFRNNLNSTDTHISESEYLEIPADIIIQNDEDIESLLIKIDNSLSTK